MHCFHLDHTNEDNYAVHVHHPLSKPRTESERTQVDVKCLEDNLFFIHLEEWHYYNNDRDANWKRVCLYLSGEELCQFRDMIEKVIASN